MNKQMDLFTQEECKGPLSHGCYLLFMLDLQVQEDLQVEY